MTVIGLLVAISWLNASPLLVSLRHEAVGREVIHSLEWASLDLPMIVEVLHFQTSPGLFGTICTASAMEEKKWTIVYERSLDCMKFFWKERGRMNPGLPRITVEIWPGKLNSDHSEERGSRREWATVFIKIRPQKNLDFPRHTYAWP